MFFVFTILLIINTLLLNILDCLFKFYALRWRCEASRLYGRGRRIGGYTFVKICPFGHGRDAWRRCEASRLYGRVRLGRRVRYV
jgi:hypothetical protein